MSNLKRDTPPDTPIAMLNLLRFRSVAQYPSGSGHAPCLGVEAYARYIAHAAPAASAVGGELLYRASAVACPVAPPDERWDEVLLARYPSVAAFFSMVMAPDYQAHSIHRTAALLDARLICTVEQDNR